MTCNWNHFPSGPKRIDTYLNLSSHRNCYDVIIADTPILDLKLDTEIRIKSPRYSIFPSSSYLSNSQLTVWFYVISSNVRTRIEHLMLYCPAICYPCMVYSLEDRNVSIYEKDNYLFIITNNWNVAYKQDTKNWLDVVDKCSLWKNCDIKLILEGRTAHYIVTMTVAVLLRDWAVISIIYCVPDSPSCFVSWVDWEIEDVTQNRILLISTKSNLRSEMIWKWWKQILVKSCDVWQSTLSFWECLKVITKLDGF